MWERPWTALHQRVVRTLDDRQEHLRRAGEDAEQRAVLAEHITNDVWTHVAAVVNGTDRDSVPSKRTQGSGFGRWLRQRRDNLPPVAASYASDNPPQTASRFLGVSPDPTRGVNAGVGLYEFFTDTGEHVYLHDMDCLGLHYRPGPAPTLTVEFTDGTDEAMPSKLADRSILVLRFLGAHLLSWDSDPDEADTYRDGTAPGGQVSGFDWDGARTFTLHLLTVTVSLTAHTVEVSTRPHDGIAQDNTVSDHDD